MVILDKYIGRTVAVSVAAVMGVLLALYLFMGFAGEFDKIGQGSYSIWGAMEYVLAQIPRRIYEFFPLSALLGTMLGLGGLASRSELVVIRSAGVSVLGVVVAVMKTALVLMVVATIVGEVIAPPLYQHAQVKRAKAMAQQISLNTDYGLWARDGLTFINIRRVQNDGTLEDIRLYEFDPRHRLHTITRAATATRAHDTWVLHGVRQTFISQDGIVQRSSAELPWRTLLNPDLINVVSVTPEMLSAWDLHEYVRYLERNGLNPARYELAFWAKLIAPLTVGVMVLLAVPFVFGSLRSVGMGTRILVGFLVGIGFYMLNQIAGHAGVVYNLPPFVSASLPTVLVSIMALIMLRRVR